MNYSQTSIANLALGRLGARNQIVNINEASPNAVKILAVWDFVFQAVLSERDWKFAKTRTELQLSNIKPLYGYCFAWVLPGDMLRFVRPVRRQYSQDYMWYAWGPWPGWYHRNDWPFHPYVDYKVEAVPTGFNDSEGNPVYQQCAITNYGGNCGNVKINYIRLITDYTQLMPGFVDALSFRLAQEVAIAITEDQKKFEAMAQMYRDSLNSAEAQNETMDYQRDEAGSESWQRAGRYVDQFWGGGWGW